MKKTLIVLTLVLAMMLQLLPVAAFAETETVETEHSATKPVFEKPEIVVNDTEPEIIEKAVTVEVTEPAVKETEEGSAEPEIVGGKGAFSGSPVTNPMYPEYSTTLRANTLSGSFDREEQTAEEVYTTYSIDNAIAYITSCMEQRKTYFTFELSFGYQPGGEVLSDLLLDMWYAAMEHNGNPTQGDYLYWHWLSVDPWEDSYYYDYSDGTCKLYAIYYADYYTTASQESALTSRINQIISGFGFTSSTTDYEKAYTIYEWVTGNITYDNEGLEAGDPMAHSAYKGVMSGTCVCQGYASIIYRMYLQVGVPCRVVAGDAYDEYPYVDPEETSDNHGWNIAKIDGKWYNLDATWDADYGPYAWDWFLKCPANFPDHSRWDEYDSTSFHADYPMATSDYKQGSSTGTLSGYCGTNLTWTLSQSGVLTISGTGKMYDYDYSNDYYAPWDSDITGISIQTVVINSGVTSIGDFAFFYCWEMDSISIPSSVTSIGDYAFYMCDSLTGVTIPGKVTTIGDNAFAWCYNLTSITIPSSVTSIGTDAFDCCNSLTGIWVNSANTKYSSDNYGVLFNRYKTTLIKCPGGYTGEYAVPSSVTTIDYSAFYGCWELTGISISNKVSTIGKWAFSCCYSLNSITIPSSVKYIYDSAFSSSESLYTIVFTGAAPTFGEDVFNGVTARAYYPTGYSSWNKAVQDYYYASEYNGVIEWVSYTPPFDETKTIAHPYVGIVTDMINELKYYEFGDYPYWGYGALYDVDGNGVKEMLLVHDAYVDNPYNPEDTMVAATFSVYTASGYDAVPLVEREPLNLYAGGPTASVEIWQKNGKSYIAAHSGNSEGLEYSYGSWTLYSVQGTSIAVDTTVEYVRAYYSSGSINYNNSYVVINGVQYGYSQYNTWKNGYTSCLEMDATMIQEQYDPNVYDQYTLVTLVRDLPIRDGRPAYNGLVAVDGVWGYYQNGVLQTDYTGLVPYGDRIFYVEEGILTFSYTGLVYYQGEWRYVANSELTDGYTGLVYFNDNWFYTVNSRIDWSFTGLVPYEGNYFYVQNNLLDWSYTGLGYHDGEWYFIQNGLLQLDFTGLVYFNNTWFYVEDGHLTFDYTGLVEYEGNEFYVQNNVLDWAYTGLGYHAGGWYYIQNALLQKGYYGLVYFNNTWFYIEDSELTWQTNGLWEHDGVLYYIANSEVDWSYTGYAKYNGQDYFVKNGVVEDW